MEEGKEKGFFFFRSMGGWGCIDKKGVHGGVCACSRRVFKGIVELCTGVCVQRDLIIVN